MESINKTRSGRGKGEDAEKTAKAGGEPTIRDDLPEIIAMANELGFKNIEIASNGLKIAESADYLMKLQEAGLSTIYFQFDGITPEPYIAARGKDLFPAKKKVIEIVSDFFLKFLNAFLNL